MEDKKARKAYVNGRMSLEEVTAFEAGLASNPALARELKAERLNHLVIHQLQKQHLKAHLESLEPAVASVSANSSRHIWMYAAIAATIALVVSLVIYASVNFSSQAIAKDYAALSVPSPPLERPGGEMERDPFNPEIAAYYQLLVTDRIDEAVIYLDSLVETGDIADNSVFFYQGYAHLRDGNYERAVNIFTPLAEQMEEEEALQYYLSLALLGAGKEEEARARLLKLEKDGNSYERLARQIIDSLDSAWRPVAVSF